MKPLKSISNKLTENKIDLALLEAINAFDQIRSLVVEDSEQRPCLAKEALLQLYQLILTIIHKGYMNGIDTDQLLRFLAIIEVDLSQITKNAESILNTAYNIEDLLLDFEKE